MTCRVVQVDGVNVIVCTSGRAGRCVICGTRHASRLCDWKMGHGRTCDRGMCEGCSTSPMPDKDLCPAHADAWEAWRAARGQSS